MAAIMSRTPGVPMMLNRLNTLNMATRPRAVINMPAMSWRVHNRYTPVATARACHVIRVAYILGDISPALFSITSMPIEKKRRARNKKFELLLAEKNPIFQVV